MENLIEIFPNYNTVYWHSLSDISKIVWSLNEYVRREYFENDSNNSDIWESKFAHLYYNYKYKNNDNYISSIINYIVNKIAFINDINQCKIIVPVPSNSKEKRLAKLVEKLSEELNLKFVDLLGTNLEYKIKNIDTNKRTYISDFIICKRTINDNEKILLIDDFLETGTTIIECIKAIKKEHPNCKIVPVVFFRKHNTLRSLR